MKIELFASCKCRMSECPMWNDRDNMLYWRGLDGEIFRKSENSSPSEFERFDLGIGNIGSMVFTDTELIFLFGDDGKVWKWVPNYRPTLYKDFKGTLFNDVLCDSKGRIYCGMLAKNFFDPEKRGKHGSLWLLDLDGKFKCLEKKLSAIPNGIRINPQQNKLYFAITDDNCVYSYDYDKNTGKLSNRKIFAENCCPDGIAIDNDENLWVTDCRPGNSKLICFTKNGVRIGEWKFPVRRITSVAFGGHDKKTLFITTAHEGKPIGEYDGGVFMMRAEVEGAKEYRYLNYDKQQI